MRVILLFSIMISGVTLSSCHKPEESVLDGSGVVVKQSSLWKTPISNNGELAEVVVEGIITDQQGSVILGANKSNQRSLLSIKAQDGTRNWEWSDLLSLIQNPAIKDPFYIRDNTYYSHNNLFFFPFSANSYCIDLSTGTTNWKHSIGLNRTNYTSGIGTTYFCTGSKPYGPQANDSLYVGDITTNAPEQVLFAPEYDYHDPSMSYGYGRIRGILPVVSSGGDALLCLLYLDPLDKALNSTNTVMSLYNYSKKQWVYSRRTLNAKGVGVINNITTTVLYQNRVYHSSYRSLHCVDLMTGEPVWSVPFSEGFGPSSFIIAEGKLIANCEDTYTYCLDPATGRQLWQEKSSGTCTPISYLNGVAYFSGGGDGRLHAIEVATGKHLWKLKSPDLSVNSGAWYYGVCVAVAGKEGQKGRVVATTGLNAYGYEAIR